MVMYILKCNFCKKPHKKYAQQRDIEHRENIIEQKIVRFLTKTGAYPSLSALLKWYKCSNARRLVRKIHYWNIQYHYPFEIPKECCDISDILNIVFKGIKQTTQMYDYDTPEDYVDFIDIREPDNMQYIPDSILYYWSLGYPQVIREIGKKEAALQDQNILNHDFMTQSHYQATGFNMNFGFFYWYHQGELLKKRTPVPAEMETSLTQLIQEESLWSYEFIIMYCIDQDIPLNWDGYFSNVDETTYMISDTKLTLLSYYISYHPERMLPLVGGLWRYSDVMAWFKNFAAESTEECELML